MERLHFAIVAPQYHPKSNGIMILYTLCDLLIALGHEVTLVPESQTVIDKNKWHAPESYHRRFVHDVSLVPADTIAIIPETSSESVVSKLPSKRRVWYLLNRPYVLTGKPLHYRPDDLVVSYSGLISNAYFNLFITKETSELSSGPNALSIPPVKENLILLYFGKSRHDNISDAVKALIMKHRATIAVINRQSPSSRSLLFDLLRRARLLVSYDPLTNLNYEATLCRTPCYIVDNYMKIKYADYNIPLHGFFEEEDSLESFFTNGIPDKQYSEIVKFYNETDKRNLTCAQDFAELCQNWFSFVDANLDDSAKASFLTCHNRLRMEVDRKVYELTGGIHVTDAMHNHTLESLLPASNLQKLKKYIIRRKKRLMENARRNWYVHVLRMSKEALHRKLDEERQKNESINYIRVP